jgi:hypothetical protein
MKREKKKKGKIIDGRKRHVIVRGERVGKNKGRK